MTDSDADPQSGKDPENPGVSRKIPDAQVSQRVYGSSIPEDIKGDRFI